MSQITLKSAADVPLEELARLVTDAFDGYVGGTFNFSVPRLADYFAGENINLNLGRVVMRGDDAAGIALIARQGWTSRLALMGIVQAAQEKGIGTQAMNYLLDDARERGDKIYELECIEQNPRGLALYTRCGFEKVQRLVGYTARDPEGEAADLETVDLTIMGRLLTLHGDADLPWSASGPRIIRHGPPFMAYHLNGAYACLTVNAEQERGILWAVFTEPHLRKEGHATHLLKAIFAAHPGLGWTVPAFTPDRYAPLMTGLGFAISDITQFQMRCTL